MKQMNLETKKGGNCNILNSLGLDKTHSDIYSDSIIGVMTNESFALQMTKQSTSFIFAWLI